MNSSHPHGPLKKFGPHGSHSQSSKVSLRKKHIVGLDTSHTRGGNYVVWKNIVLRKFSRLNHSLKTFSKT